MLSLMKILFRCLVIVNTLLIQINTGMTSPPLSWELVKVDRVLDNKTILLFDGRVIQLLGVTPPSLFDKADPYFCHARHSFRLMKLLLEDKTISIRADKSFPDNTSSLFRHVKLENKQNLAEFLLQKGLARVMTTSESFSFQKEYQKAEKMAQEEFLGIWKGCGDNNQLHRRMIQSGERLKNTSQASFLAPISVGKVTKVLSGNLFEIEPGIRVKILNVDVPSSEDERKGFSCFGNTAKEYLESLLLHKQVFLRRDIAQLDEDGVLLRYVFLPFHDKRGSELFINEKMIREGYGKHAPNDIDTKYKERFEQAQASAYREKRGAWGQCIKALLSEK